MLASLAVCDGFPHSQLFLFARSIHFEDFGVNEDTIWDEVDAIFTDVVLRNKARLAEYAMPAGPCWVTGAAGQAGAKTGRECMRESMLLCCQPTGRRCCLFAGI